MARAFAQPRDLASLSRRVTAWAWISVGAQIALSIFSYLEAAALGSIDGSEKIAWLDSVLDPEIDLIAGVVALIMVTAFIVSSVISLRWIYLANKNAHVIADGVTMSPGWNVGWFFVPFANLFKPFEGMEQIWRASKDPENWSNLEIPNHLRWWWAFWLTSTIIGTASARLEINATTAGGRLLCDVADMVSTALFIPATVLFLRIVREITAFQGSSPRESGAPPAIVPVF